jgi:hypothetical protein
MVRHKRFFSHPDYNRRFRNFTESTAAPWLAGCELKRRVADSNRRLRFSLTPKNCVTYNNSQNGREIPYGFASALAQHKTETVVNGGEGLLSLLVSPVGTAS